MKFHVQQTFCFLISVLFLCVVADLQGEQGKTVLGKMTFVTTLKLCLMYAFVFVCRTCSACFCCRSFSQKNICYNLTAAINHPSDSNNYSKNRSSSDTVNLIYRLQLYFRHALKIEMNIRLTSCCISPQLGQCWPFRVITYSTYSFCSKVKDWK